MNKKITLVLLLFIILLSGCSYSDEGNTVQNTTVAVPTIPPITYSPTHTPTAAPFSEETYIPAEEVEIQSSSCIDISIYRYNVGGNYVIFFDTQYSCANVYINNVLVSENYKNESNYSSRKRIAEILPEYFIEDELIDIIIELMDESGNVAKTYEIKKLYYTSTEENLENVCQSKDIEYLFVNSVYISGDIECLGSLENLVYINLWASDYITGDIESLSNLNQLEVLIMHNSEVTGNIESIGHMSNLRILNLNGSGSLHGDLSAYKELVNLETIRIDECYEIHGDLSFMKNLTELKYIELTAGVITGSTSDLSHLVNLEHIDLWYCNDIIGDVSDLCNLVNLKSYSFEGCDGITGSYTLPNGLVIRSGYSGGID